MENYFQTKIIFIFANNDEEYQKLKPIFNVCVILHFISMPHTSETCLSLLLFTSLPISYWSYVFQAAVYLINRLPSSILSFQYPFSKIFHRAPNYQQLKMFGCLCYPWLRPYITYKLQPRSTPCIFLGYSTTQSAYKCLDSSSNRLYTSHHVKFVENVFPLQVHNNSQQFSNLFQYASCAGFS